MITRRGDTELSAITRILGVLEPMTSAERGRVLDYVSSRAATFAPADPPPPQVAGTATWSNDAPSWVPPGA